MRIAICDDMKETVDKLAEIITIFFENKEVYTNFEIDKYYTGFSFAEAIDDDKKYDLVFMDIKLGKDNGIRLCEKIVEKSNDIKVVFITAYREFAEDIFAINPFYFLVKPINLSKVEKVFEKYENFERRNMEHYGHIKTKDGEYTLESKNILYAESNGRYIIFTDIDGKQYKSIMTMEEVCNEFEDRLVRCHRSYFVNINKAIGIEKTNMFFTDGKRVPISRRKYKEMMEMFTKRFRKEGC